MFTDNVVFFKKIRKNTWTFYICVPKISMTWFTVPEVWSVADGNWQFWVIFHPFPTEKPSKSEFWNYEKNCWRYYYFMHVYQKTQSYDVWFLRYGLRHRFFVILHLFLSPKNSQNQNFKKMKKIPGDIIILQMECGRNFCFVLFFAL